MWIAYGSKNFFFTGLLTRFTLQHKGDSWNLPDGSSFFGSHHAWGQSKFSQGILLPIYKISQQKSLNAFSWKGLSKTDFPTCNIFSLKNPTSLMLYSSFTAYHLESENHLGLKTLSPTINPTLPTSPPKDVSKCHIYLALKYPQRCWLNHFPGEPVLVLSILTVKKFLIISNLNLPWHNLRPHPHVLLLVICAFVSHSQCS